MAIPGVTPELPCRTKVRVGDKDERGYPRSLDHFICDDPEMLAALAGDKPKALIIRLPYKTLDECFPSGLEKWMRSKSGTQILGCYTKGDGTAHRLGKRRDENGDIILDPTPGSSRQSMPCKGMDCPLYGSGPSEGCRPQARLNFFIDGDPRRDSVFRFETKSLNTYEEVAAVLSQYPDLRVPTFKLWAERRKKAAKQYTVVCIEEQRVQADTASPPADPPVTQSDTPPAPSHEAKALKAYLVASPDHTWPMTDAQIEWVKKIGPAAALKAIQEKQRAAAHEAAE